VIHSQVAKTLLHEVVSERDLAAFVDGHTCV